jgi:hypothetical protein
MAAFHFSFRAATSCLLMIVLSGVLPATGADALPKAQDTTPQSVAQQPADQTPAIAAPAKRHRSPWIWVAVVAGIAAGAGAGIIVGNRQSGKTSAPIPGATVGVGGPSPGGPH